MTAHSASDFFLYNSRRSISYAFFEISGLVTCILILLSFTNGSSCGRAPISLVTAIRGRRL